MQHRRVTTEQIRSVAWDADDVHYIALPEHNAVIEVGSELHENPAARKHDAAKQERLEVKGLRVYQLA